MVRRFAATLDFNGYTGAYIYAITTCGAFAGNAVSQLNDLLRDTHGIELN
jgi:hypothetical protein